MADFDKDDLAQTIDGIRSKLSNGESVVGLLEEIVSLVRDRENWWQTQFDELVSAQQEAEVERADSMRAQVYLIKAFKQSRQRQKMLEKSVIELGAVLTKSVGTQTEGIQRLEKARVMTVNGKTTGQGLTLEQEAQRGFLAKTALRLWGPGGGKAVAYEKNLASKLLAEGRINQTQHGWWKKTGRLPDGVL